MSGQDSSPVSTRTLTVLVYVVTACWVVVVLAPLVIDDYDGNTGANGIMGALLGLLGAWRYQASRRHSEPQGQADSDE